MSAGGKETENIIPSGVPALGRRSAAVVGGWGGKACVPRGAGLLPVRPALASLVEGTDTALPATRPVPKNFGC